MNPIGTALQYKNLRTRVMHTLGLVLFAVLAIAVGGLAQQRTAGPDDVIVKIGHHKLGEYLMDIKERSLYLNLKDSKNTSNCYEQCATTWPPLLVKGKPVAGEGFGVMDDFYEARLLGTATRRDGSMQVTFNGWPLYYYSGDKEPGEFKGHEVDSTWFLVHPQGVQLGKQK